MNLIDDLTSDLLTAQRVLLQMKEELGYAMSTYQIKLAMLHFAIWMQSHPVFDDEETLRKEAVLILKQFSFKI